jgi:hypothetical protein
MEELNEIDVEWISDRKREKRNNHRYKLHKDLVSVIYRKIQTNSSGMNEHLRKMVVGYTKAVMIASSIEQTMAYGFAVLLAVCSAICSANFGFFLPGRTLNGLRRIPHLTCRVTKLLR